MNIVNLFVAKELVAAVPANARAAAAGGHNGPQFLAAADPFRKVSVQRPRLAHKCHPDTCIAARILRFYFVLQRYHKSHHFRITPELFLGIEFMSAAWLAGRDNST